MRVLRYFLSFAFVLLLVCPFNTYAQSISPPGKWIVLEGSRFYYYCYGSGSHSVLMDGGIGDASVNWLPVQNKLAEQFRVCTYDRGGYGLSDPGQGKRTSGQIVTELYRLVKAVGVSPPYIVVGQSFGGFTAQLFARRYPNETAGIVLVDSSHPQQMELLSDLDRYAEEGVQLVTGRDETKVGDIGVLQKHWYMLNSRRKAVLTQMDELKYFDQSAAELRAAGPMPDIPLAVLTRGQQLLPTMENGHSMEEVWLEMQKDLANSSKQGWQHIVEGSGHNIHLDVPEAIIDAVFKVYAASTGT